MIKTMIIFIIIILTETNERNKTKKDSLTDMSIDSTDKVLINPFVSPNWQ